MSAFFLTYVWHYPSVVPLCFPHFLQDSASKVVLEKKSWPACLRGQASLLSDGPSSGSCVPLDTKLTLPRSPSTPMWKGRVYYRGEKPLLPIPFSLAASGSSYPTAALVFLNSQVFCALFFHLLQSYKKCQIYLGHY